jgi:hypothetical protein
LPGGTIAPHGTLIELTISAAINPSLTGPLQRNYYLRTLTQGNVTADQMQDAAACRHCYHHLPLPFRLPMAQACWVALLVPS